MDKIILEGGHRLHGKVTISGSKNACLPLMAASLLANSPTKLRNVPSLRDIMTMMIMLGELGAKAELTGSTLTIDPTGFSVPKAPYNIVRKMRASIYVLGPLIATLGRAVVSLPGGCAIGPRPIDLHLKGLAALGADINLSHGYIVASNPGLKGAEIVLEGPHGSSVGATNNVMMAASRAKGTTTIRGAAREPEVVELATLLREMGAEIEGEGTSTLTIRGVNELRGVEHTVIPDRIEAGTFMTMAGITQGDILIQGCQTQHMEAIINKLLEIGIEVTHQDDGVRVKGTDRLRPAPIRTLPYPGFPTDMQAQFTALLCLAEGQSIITETIYVDRFIHVGELLRMGADIEVHRGTAIVRGVKKLSAASVMASDLRASAALIVAGLAAEGRTEVLRVYHIDRGYERIEQKLALLGAKIQRVDTTKTEELESASSSWGDTPNP
jgi:UDP-N-acetylglucosamine 1-carboxyvinyltransferase